MKDQGLALYNAVVIDGTGKHPIKNGVVLIRDGRINAISQYKTIDIPKDYQQINLHGYTILPGFINSHVHNSYDERQLQKWLRAGVTTVRDLGPRKIKGDFLELRDRYNLNPKNTRIVSSTPVFTSCGGYGRKHIETIEDAIDVTKAYISKGVDIIKISIESKLQGCLYNQLSFEQMEAIISTAKRYNKHVATHVSWEKDLKKVVAAGAIEFSRMVVDPLSNQFLYELVEKGVYCVPTLELWKGLSISYDKNYEYCAINNLKRFYRAGGKVAFGTDFGGFLYHFDGGFPITEVRLMQIAGMSINDIIVSATKHASEVCGLSDEIGTLEVGKKADLFVVKGNPLDNDLNAFMRTYMVMKNGYFMYV